MTNIALRLLACSALAALAGCAGTGTRTAEVAATPEEAVLARAAERWDHLVNRRFDEAWAYLSPGVRSARPKERYAAELSVRPVRWTLATPVGAECTPEPPACTVTFEVGYSVRSHLTGVGTLEAKSAVSERWIALDGSWYHVPEEVTGR